MLLQLMVKDFALIDNIKIEFDPNMNVLTGETGAGKSIIIDAVSLLLGARANSEDVRYGCNRAFVEGVFEVPNQGTVAELLESLGDTAEDGLVILRRELSSAGKNICRINDNVVTLGHFKAIGQQLINIYGQHDYQAISNKEMHLGMLDSLGDAAFRMQQSAVAEAYDGYQQLRNQWEALQQQAQSGTDRLDFLRYKLEEFREYHLESGEEERLEQELLRWDNFEKISGNADKAYQYLYGDNRSVYALLTAATDKLKSIAEYDEKLPEMLEGLESMLYQAEEYGRTLSHYSDGMELDEDRREQANARKFELDKLKRKYQRSIDELLEQQQAWQQELDSFENIDGALQDIAWKAEQAKAVFVTEAEKLSALRKQSAIRLAEALKTQLVDLAMEQTRFEVRFEEKAPSVHGIDQVEFLFSANPGQPLKPLSQIASGGEMSRIMLAFKTVLAEYEQIDTMIFDEIDTGIGGNILMQVAEKLSAVSRNAQVICVTHAAQIAALADRHFRIQKQVFNDQTETRIVQLDAEGEITELARMLGGSEEFQLQHARELKKKKAKA